MRKIKHFAGYGTVKAGVIKDGSCTLHVKVEGNHEWGICRYGNDEYLLYNWLVKRFDKTVPDYVTWHRLRPIIDVHQDIRMDMNDPSGCVDICDYYFHY